MSKRTTGAQGATTQEMSASDIYDKISRCIIQSQGMVDCLGNLDLEGGSLEDFSLNAASWAVKDLLEQASTYASALLEIAKRQEGGAA